MVAYTQCPLHVTHLIYHSPPQSCLFLHNNLSIFCFHTPLMLDECIGGQNGGRSCPQWQIGGWRELQRPVRGALCRVPATAASLLASLPSLRAAAYQLPPPAANTLCRLRLHATQKGWGRLQKIGSGQNISPESTARLASVFLWMILESKKAQLWQLSVGVLGKGKVTLPSCCRGARCCRSGETAAGERCRQPAKDLPPHILLIVSDYK